MHASVDQATFSDTAQNGPQLTLPARCFTDADIYAREMELKEFAPRLGELEFSHRSTADLACNWKVAVENYGECYHCEYAHPTLMTGLLSPDSYRVETFERHHRHSTGTAAGHSEHTIAHLQNLWRTSMGEDYAAM